MRTNCKVCGYVVYVVSNSEHRNTRIFVLSGLLVRRCIQPTLQERLGHVQCWAVSWDHPDPTDEVQGPNFGH